jgi:polyphenol oxidase
MTANALDERVRVVEERLAVTDGVPLFVIQEWAARFPWLFAATTGAGDDGEFDLGLFGAQPVGESMARWRALIAAAGMSGAAHSRQAHGRLVQTHAAAHTGLLVSEGFDGHATRASGLLLAVSIADCIPVFLVDEDARAVALVHAGWRGVAADILDVGLAALAALAGTPRERAWLHAGPAICGRCYEVGPEVFEALGLARPATNSLIDVRAVLASNALRKGLDPERVSVSAHCTRCGPGRFFSHRAGQKGRQMGVLGMRA